MSSTTGKADKFPSSTSTQPCFRFSLAEIQSATKDFDDDLVIGEGGFGKVYKGCISFEETSHVVAIKRLDSTSNQGAPEFRAEIEMLSKLRHCHLVSLIGYCDDNMEMILIYEYMPHGTLYHHLHKAETPLSWVQRLKIAIGAGPGLDYLHTGFGTQQGVIHRDVKSSNILLDENWAALISDFGLSKIGPTNQSSSYVDASVKGTFGYLDLEYFYTRKLTRKTDVYAFGVVLFELLSGRLAVDERNGEDQCSLVRWAQRCVKERKLDQMVDPKIKGTVFPKCLRGFAQIADRCLCSDLKQRPTMAEVVVSLQALLELQQRYENSAESAGITGFTWKIHKYLVSATKQSTGSFVGMGRSIDTSINEFHTPIIMWNDGNFDNGMKTLNSEINANVEFQTTSGQMIDLITTLVGEKDLSKYSLFNTSDILYYEVLDIPFPELQGLKTLKVAFHHATKDMVVINTIGLPKQSIVRDDLNIKVELPHPDVELRLLEVFYHKIYKIYFPLNEKIENTNAQYWTLRAEEDCDASFITDSRIGKRLGPTGSTNQNGSSSSKSTENNMNQCSLTNNEGSCHGERPHEQQEELADTNLKWFAYYDLKRATKNFGNATCLSDKSYALVYKGWLDKTTYSPSEENTGLPIAVKRLDRYERVHQLDLEMLEEFRHPNLEKLIGYGLHGKQLFLVYEFMPNGNFEDQLHSGVVARLPLVTKVKIAVGISRAIVFLHRTQDQVGVDPYPFGCGKVNESRLDRHKILLDEDFTAKLSDYDVTKLVHYGYPRETRAFNILHIGDYYPGFEPVELRTDILGFAVLFAEVLTGKQLYYQTEFQKIDNLFIQHGEMSLVDIAYACFEICNELDSELRMLRILEQHIPASQYAEFTTKNYESCLSGKTGFTWNVHKYLLPATTKNADQNGTSSSKSTENNINQLSPTKKDGSDHGEMPRQHEELVVTHLKCFTYHELIHATENFRNGRWLSDKRYAKLYRFWMYSEDNTGLPIAIKRLDCYARSDPLDLEMLIKEFSHPNLVKLIGYCLQGGTCKHPFLVYESLPNGNFDNLMHSGVVALLSLITKVKIAVGIARGIVYLQKTHDQVGAYPSRNGTVSESRLDRKKILLDEDFTAKLSDYDVTMLVHGRCSQITRTSNKLHSSELHSNLSGFTVLFAEVLIGKQISNQNEFQKIDDLFTQHEKMYLVHIAKSCFEICNDVDSESKMLRILEEYEQYIPAYEFTTEAFESCLSEPAEPPLAERVSLIEEVSTGPILLEPPEPPLVEKVSLIEGISRGPVLLESAELPLVESVNLIEGISSGHICLQDTIAREPLLEMP